MNRLFISPNNTVYLILKWTEIQTTRCGFLWTKKRTKELHLFRVYISDQNELSPLWKYVTGGIIWDCKKTNELNNMANQIISAGLSESTLSEVFQKYI